ncbi:phenylalanine--tRNA ligase subunit alpha [Halosimplex carlsbadense]|uniref:winged helix DNA-binding protein n=1 Tax=Halosimplex carlsbadense TaxID=171164 RepID=UPI0006777F51|nr:winged helix DNA-binding protein [Halosimplex carlsbadense]
MSQHPDWFRRADAAILQHLVEERPTYLALVANRLGMPADYAQRRMDRLVADGLVEPVTEEVVYRITERGERRLAAYTEREGSPEAGLVAGN